MFVRTFIFTCDILCRWISLGWSRDCIICHNICTKIFWIIICNRCSQLSNLSKQEVHVLTLCVGNSVSLTKYFTSSLQADIPLPLLSSNLKESDIYLMNPLRNSKVSLKSMQKGLMSSLLTAYILNIIRILLFYEPRWCLIWSYSLWLRAESFGSILIFL